MERKNEELKVALSAARSSGADDVARAEAKVASATTEARAKIAAAERAAREAKAATDAAEAKAAAAEKARDDAVECLNVARAECEAEVKAAELRAANVEYDLETLRNRLRQSESGKRALLELSDELASAERRAMEKVMKVRSRERFVLFFTRPSVSTFDRVGGWVPFN
jgi:colicin import membrane protein